VRGRRAPAHASSTLRLPWTTPPSPRHGRPSVCKPGVPHLILVLNPTRQVPRNPRPPVPSRGAPGETAPATSRMPSPQASTVQLARQPSLPSLLPPSHASPSLTTPLPHAVGVRGAVHFAERGPHVPGHVGGRVPEIAWRSKRRIARTQARPSGTHVQRAVGLDGAWGTATSGSPAPRPGGSPSLSAQRGGRFLRTSLSGERGICLVHRQRRPAADLRGGKPLLELTVIAHSLPG